jgi:hypothetical protein
MFSTLDLILLVLVLCIGVFVYYANSNLARLTKALDDNADSPLFQPQFKCVLVKPTTLSCQLARDLSTKALLVDDAPILPLEGCNALQCHCSFTHRDDRRTGVDRRANEDPQRTRVYLNKRVFKDRRRDSIRDFLLPQSRAFR